MTTIAIRCYRRTKNPSGPENFYSSPSQILTRAITQQTETNNVPYRAGGTPTQGITHLKRGKGQGTQKLNYAPAGIFADTDPG